MSYSGGLALVFKGRGGKARENALRAAAQVVVNGLKDEKPLGLRGGYTSGDFVTGNLLNSIFVTDPKDGEIAVATDVLYAIYWEYGHFNLFLRRYVREERWLPTLLRTAEDAFRAYQRVYDREMT